MFFLMITKVELLYGCGYCLLGFLVIGILGNMIHLVWADRRKRKKAKKPERDSIDYNPDYGIDYGEAEIRDGNDYYAA